MMAFKAFKMIILAPTVTFLVIGCSSSDDSPKVLPQVDGLNLLNPQLNAATVENSVQAHEQREAVQKETEALQKIATAENRARISDEMAALDAKKQELTLQKEQLVVELETLTKTGRTFHKTIALSTTDKVLDQKIAEITQTHRNKATQIDKLRDEHKELGFFARRFTDQAADLNNKITKLEAERASLETQLAQLTKEKAQLADAQNAKMESSRKRSTELSKERQESLANLNEKISQLDKQIADGDQQKAELTTQIAQLEASLVRTENTELSANKQLELEFQKLKLKIMNQYKANENVSAADIVEALMMKHFLATPQEKLTFEDMTAQLQSIAQKISTKDIRSLKSDYENIISADLHKNVKLTYNRDAVSILDPLINNKIQCYSGTLLFLILNELIAHTHDHTVVILTRGHVLPGFIQFNQQGQMNLYGIESTADGRAVIDYGKTSSIYGDIRVFDAQQFLMVELFKNEINDFQGLYTEMLKTTALYGFVTDEFKALELSANGANTDDILNSSLLGFGRSSVAAGDIVRATFDTQLNTNFQKVTPVAAPVGAIEGSPVEWARVVEKRCDELYSAFHFYQTTEATKYKFYQYYCSEMDRQEPCENYNESRDYQVALLKRFLDKMCVRDDRDIQLIPFKFYLDVAKEGGYSKSGYNYNIPLPPSDSKKIEYN